MGKMWTYLTRLENFLWKWSIFINTAELLFVEERFLLKKVNHLEWKATLFLYCQLLISDYVQALYEVCR